ncbi:MAG: VCBS domain-containing protein, partial [Sulfuricella sp.]
MPATITGSYGSLSVAADGSWAYNLNNSDPAVQALAAGQNVVEPTFTVALSDGSTTTVNISVTGSNDVAVISSGTGSV